MGTPDADARERSAPSRRRAAGRADVTRTTKPARRAASAPPDDVNDLVELSRLLVSVAYRSLEATEQAVPLPQFRALTVLARYGPCTAGGLAEALDQVGSTVTRMCDRLVAAGLVTRQNRPDNRREVEIDVTKAGRRLVEQVLAARAAELEQMLQRMRPGSRAALAKVLPELLAAADEHLPDSRARWAV